MISVQNFQPVVEDQHTAARAYFLCVVGMLFFEGIVQLPAYFMTLRHVYPSSSSTNHWKPYVLLHKVITYPSVVPFLTRHRIPSLFRLGVFVFLNFLWGWNRIEFSTDYQLYGWLTIANGGLALLLASRTNVFTVVLRVPPSSLLLYHRWIGTATFIHATLHFSLTVQQFINSDELDTVLLNVRIRVGIMAWLALALIFLTSLPFVRRRGFELFYYSHFLFLIFVGGALYHASKGPEFLLPGLFLWAIDRAIRFSYNFRNICLKSVSYYPGDVTKFKFEGIKTVYPGQMVWMQIPSISFFNWHPFTIVSTSDSGVATIAVRGLGHYTKKVQLLENNDSGLETEHSGSAGAVASLPANEVPRTRIVLDGPYGVGRIQWSRYPVIVIVAGGIGVTPGISIASHIIDKAGSHASSERSWHIHLLWTVKDKRHAMWFEEELKALASLASNPSLPVSLDVTIHATGSSTSESDVTGGEGYAMETPYKYSGPGVIYNGRPNVLEWFQHIKELRNGQDAAVSLCGPRALMDDARRAAAKVSWEKSVFSVDEEEFEL